VESGSHVINKVCSCNNSSKRLPADV